MEAINRPASEGAELKEGEGSDAKGKEENEARTAKGFRIKSVVYNSCDGVEIW